MAEAAYTHKVLTIKCCIDSYASTIKKNPTNIKVKSGSNDDYFANLMTKVRKKFKFLDNLDDSEWDMKIGGDIVEKGNGDKLKEILQRIPPVPVIQIVKTQISEDRYVITLHFGDQKFDYPLTGAPDDWNEDIYTDLVQTIRDKFNLQSEFALYEDCGGSHVDMDGMDDIADSFDETDDISKAMPDMVDSKGLNVLHLFIRQESQNANQFKIMVDDGSSFFEWIPPNAETDDEKEWESNYDALLNDIAKRYNFDKNDIELQYHDDVAAIDMDADELNELWQELVEDDSSFVTVLSSNVTSSNGDIAPDVPIEPGKVVNNATNVNNTSNKTMQFKRWFDDTLQLPQYCSLFIDKGYVNVEYITDLDEEELMNHIGIKSKPHRRKILQAIQTLSGQQSKQHALDKEDSKTETESQSNTDTGGCTEIEGDGEGVTSQYKTWFETVLRLPQYYQVFVESGYEGFDDLKCDLDQQLIDIGIRKKPHRKRILNGINDILNNKKLFTDIQACDFDKIAKPIHALGGVDIVNHFKSPFDDTKERIWMSLCRANGKVTAQEKLAFLKRFETEFRPNFNLTDGSDGNVIHVLCGENKSVDTDTASLLLEYFVNDSQRISKDAFTAQDAQQRTPLHCSVTNDKIKCVHLLLPLYTDDQLTQLKDANGKSIVDLASKHQQIKQILPKTIQIDGNNDESDEMKSWLENTVKLPQYYQLFIEAGYEDMSYLDETIEDRDLREDVGITVQSHRKTILHAIKSLSRPLVGPETGDQKKKTFASTVTEGKIGNDADADVSLAIDITSLSQPLVRPEWIDDTDISPIVNVMDALIDLGSNIATFDDSQKKSCHAILEYILHLDEIKPEYIAHLDGIDEYEEDTKQEEDGMVQEEVLIMERTRSLGSTPLGVTDNQVASNTLQRILKPISEDKSAQFIECIMCFLRIIGFQANHVQNQGFKIKGTANRKVLNEMVRNFYYLSNAMQKPKMNVYQQLNIRIPNDGSVVKHKSGLYDNEFITFLLPQIVMENQQSSLVNKVTLDPAHLERFINFLVPNSSKYLCREIYFEKLKPLKVSAIGLFGSRKEVLCMLMKYKSISKALYDKLIDDETNDVLSPGIHGILPVHLQQENKMHDWDRVIYLFYWSLPNSFDMVKMKGKKGVKNMRRDPACLLSRVLYEISSTVAIMVSSSELHDFGVVKHSGKKIKKQKRTIRRVKLVIEETKENQIMCLDQATPQKEIQTHSNVHKNTASNVLLFGGGCMTGWCQFYPQKARIISKPVQWRGSTKDEVVDKIKELNTEYILSLDPNLDYQAKCIVAESIVPKQYAAYKQKIDQLRDEENAENAANKLKQQVGEIIARRHEDILQAFFNKYNTKQYCQEHHSAMCEIMEELGDDIAIDIALDATKYASMKFIKPSQSLPDIQYYLRYKSTNCLSQVTRDLKAKLDTHFRQISRIESKKDTDLKAADVFEKKEKEKQKGKKGALRAIGEAFGVVDEEVILTDEEITSKKKTMIRKAKREAVRDIRYQRNQTLKQWIKIFGDACETYRHKLYDEYTNRNRVTNGLKTGIKTKYCKLRSSAKLKLEEAMKHNQSTKTDMLITTLSRLTIEKATRYKAGKSHLLYYVPETIPPTYAMQFVSIDLKNMEDEMRTQTMKNMHYEMPQNSDLI
eukprot:801980_1